MFWKKDEPSILVEYQSDNLRKAYRLIPDRHTPIALVVSGERVNICNISATGVAFSMEAGQDLIIGNDHCVQAVLFSEAEHRHPIPLLLEVLEQHGNVYRCNMKTYSRQGKKGLCRYLISHQKREIRQQRQASSATDPA